MTEAKDPGAGGHWSYAAAAVVVAILWLVTLPARPLFNPDEGRYAEIPREMLATGDWVIPHLDGLAYVEKPPLQYWATAAALKCWGNTEFAARAYTALCALATLLVVGFTAARLWGRAAAWRAAAVLSGMLLFVVLGQLLTLDMSLTFFMTASLGAFLLAQHAAVMTPGRGGARTWMWAAWAAAGLGVLTKGLVAAAIPAAVLVSYSTVTRDLTPWRRLAAASGVCVFLAITVPWHWLAARRLPDFLQFFFVHEHLSRYLTPSADREEPWWFFGVVFLLGSVPWTFSALRVLLTRGNGGASHGQFDAPKFLRIWIGVILVFFSFSDSKLIPYILPALPAVALLVGASAPAPMRRDLRIGAAFTLAAAAGLAAASAFGPQHLAATERNRYFELLAGPLLAGAALLAVTATLTWARRRDATQATVLLGVGWCLTGMLFMRAAALVAPIYSGSVLARAVAVIPSRIPVFSVGTYDQTLPFYWQRTVTLVAYRGELDFGLRRNPTAEIPSVAEFVARWDGMAEAYAVMDRNLFDQLSGRGVPMRRVAADVHRILVARR